MIQLLLLHICVVGLAIIFASIGVNLNRKEGASFKLNYGYILSFLFLFLLMGFRINLGRDWEGYETIYNSIYQQEYVFGDSRELGFLLLVRLLRSLDFEFQSFIIVSSFLTLFFFFVTYRKFYFLLPFGIFIFWGDWGYTVSINTIRQGIALMLFLNASLYIDSNEKHAGLKFLLFSFLAFLFHYSVILFLPFYYIGRLKLGTIPFVALCALIFVTSLFVILPAFQDIISLMDKYQHYANDDRLFSDSNSFGLGALLLLSVRLAPISVFSYVKKRHPSILKFFVLYFIGLCVYYGFYKYMLIIRFTFYLQFMELFVMAYFLYFLFIEKKKNRLFGYVYVIAILFNYIYTFKDFLADQLLSSNVSLMFIDFVYHQ